MVGLLFLVVFRCVLRIVLYAAIVLLLVGSFPYLQRGQVPPWVTSSVAWIVQSAPAAWTTLQSLAR